MRVPQEDVLYTLKIVICGGGGAGKTCLFNRYCFNSFSFDTAMTIGINFHTTYLPLKFRNNLGKIQEKYVVNSIFDLAGQEKFKPLIPTFLDGANGALIVFDSVSFSSFQQLDYWYDKIIEIAGDIPKILIGSKSDLLKKVPEGEVVKGVLINEFVKEKHMDGFMRTSALENYNVLEVFKALTNLMLKKQDIEASII